MFRFLAFLVGFSLVSTAYGAKVKLKNKTGFELKIEYNSPSDTQLKTRAKLKPKEEKYISTDLIKGDSTHFYIENISPYGEKAKKEMNAELGTGLGWTSAATLAVCAVAPLLAPPVAIAGAVLVSAKYYWDCVYFDSILVPNELPENTELVITINQENTRKFSVSSEIVELAQIDEESELSEEL